MLSRLLEDHQRLREIAGSLDDFLGEPCVPIDPDFARLRWELMRVLSCHLALERRAFGDVPQMRQISAGLDPELDAALEKHMQVWTGTRMCSAWNDYRVEARALLARLRRRMTAEEGGPFRQVAAA